MFEFFSAYSNYPYKVPARVRFFNFFRYWFKLPLLERILISQILKGNTWWKKAIPPIYFYKENTIRKAQRDNINYILDISCLIDHSIYFCTLEEPASQNLFKIAQSNFIVFDVGANIGFVTLNLAKCCSDGFVYAFEPDSRTFNTLQVNLKENNYQNIASYQVALGTRTEKMLLSRIERTNPGANRILPQRSPHEYDQEWVDVEPLDLIADRLSIPRVDLIKIDVEGFELFVLKGAENLIRKFKPILFVELSEVNLRVHGLSAALLIQYIEGLNYEVKDARTMAQIDRLKTDYHTDLFCFPNK
jgi:FkbM family methyltransferase